MADELEVFRALISKGLAKAYAKHGRDSWGRHEMYGILLEEFDELWDEIKTDAPQERVLEEIVDIAVVLFRYWQTGDRYRGAHPQIWDDEPASYKSAIGATVINPKLKVFQQSNCPSKYVHDPHDWADLIGIRHCNGRP